MKKIASSFGFRQKASPSPAVLEPRIFGPGVTGADPSIAIFDGTSSNPKDYLIDLETDLMETYPDTRSYFHWVGQVTQEATIPPVDLEERKVYDTKLVRQGREYLQAARARGHGLYLSDDRDLLAHNVPGGPWYRMPLAGIVNDFLRREDQPRIEEGGFMLDPDQIDGVEKVNMTGRGEVLLTNIRCAIWWADTLRPGIMPGTRGWDCAIHTLYRARSHPSSVMWAGAGGRSAIVSELYKLDSRLFQVDRAVGIVRKDWYRKEDDSDEDGIGSDDDSGHVQNSTSTSNRLIFDPAFLAEIQLAKSKSRGFFRRGK